jgi:hypothetical protein
VLQKSHLFRRQLLAGRWQGLGVCHANEAGGA